MATVEYKNWITHVQTPRVERMLKEAALGDAISFAGALPAEEMFPTREIEAAFREVISSQAGEALQYFWTEGYEPLREQIAAHMKARGVPAEKDEILVTSGAQQALDLLAKLLIKPGTHIALETPTYLPAIQAFELQHPKLEAVSRSQQELDCGMLRRILKGTGVQFVYVVATGHNPSGASMSLEQRKELLEMAAEFNVPILEDGAYAELQYGEQLPNLAALAPEPARVIYVGSFSKVLSPGLRIGWIVAPVAIIRRLTLIKQATDLQSSTLSQLVLSRYLQENSFDAHLGRCVKFYGERREAMLKALQSHMPNQLRWTIPLAGFSLWVELPENISAEGMLPDAIDRGVAFEPGMPFFATEKHQNFFRLSFSAQRPEFIQQGIVRLGNMLAEKLSPVTETRS
jgi:2-aminoadipate transaminase